MNSRSSRLRLNFGMAPWCALARSSLARPVRDTGGLNISPSSLGNTPTYSPMFPDNTCSGSPNVNARMGCCCRTCWLTGRFLCRGLGIVSTRDVAATAPLVGVQGFIGQGVHDRPGDVGVAGGVGARGAVGHLAAVGGAALDG